MINVVEECTDVCVNNPFDPQLVAVSPQMMNRLMGTAPFPKPPREIVKVILINRAHENMNRTLHNLIFKRGHPQRALFTILFGYPGTFNRGSLIPPAAQTLMQILKILFQVACIFPGGNSINPGSAAFTRALKGFP
ncbi:MAG: hypothetical protein ACD_28C00009G0001 [uncultured bacterium]|nr:MAG: hypothetical protein ACD_28C00009G0001 [uncultured bacterium]